MLVVGGGPRRGYVVRMSAVLRVVVPAPDPSGGGWAYVRFGDCRFQPLAGPGWSRTRWVHAVPFVVLGAVLKSEAAGQVPWAAVKRAYGGGRIAGRSQCKSFTSFAVSSLGAVSRPAGQVDGGSGDRCAVGRGCPEDSGISPVHLQRRAGQ
jgi:hypothetical protein